MHDTHENQREKANISRIENVLNTVSLQMIVVVCSAVVNLRF